MRNHPFSPIVLALGITLSACGDNDGVDEADVAGDDGEQRGEQLANQADTELGNDTDEVVIAKAGAIMLAMDEGEVLHSSYVIDVAANPEVIAFATRMITEHTNHAAETTSLLAGLDLSPQDNTVATALRAEAMAGLAELERTPDEEIDRAYMRMQVMMHAQALVILDTLENLAPVDALAQFVAQTRTATAAHRTEAELILREM